MPTNQETLWTTDDVARYLRISRRKFSCLRSQGQMAPPVAQLGNRLLFEPQEVRAWVQAGCPRVTDWEILKQREDLRF